jgi:molecular chaperone GrpE
MPNENDTQDAELSAQEGSADFIGGGSNAGAASAEDVEKLRGERDSLFERLARTTADFQNARKRLEAESDQRLQYANSGLLKNLLPVIDNLERAMAVDVDKTDVQSLLKGLQVVMDQVNKVLASQHVESIVPQPGEPFDPTRHEALMHQPSDTVEPGAVTQVLQKGYTLRDRVLRPAQVAVAS